MIQQTSSQNKQKLLSILPSGLVKYLSNETEEIRFRKNQPVIFLESQRELITPFRMDGNRLEELLDNITEGSPASYFDSFRNGFITIKGGHRVGIAGTTVYDDGKISYIKDISSINLRIAREMPGVADRLFQTVGRISPLPGILMISPPGHGKTTLLRDFVRQLSTKCAGTKIAVVDERNEIAATYHGEMQNALGPRCDVLNGYRKADGILSAVRSLSPNVIIVDEIGTPEDEECLCYAHHAGVSVVATVHGTCDGLFRKNIRKLTQEQVFDYEVYVKKNGKDDRIESILKVKGEA